MKNQDTDEKPTWQMLCLTLIVFAVSLTFIRIESELNKTCLQRIDNFQGNINYLQQEIDYYRTLLNYNYIEELCSVRHLHIPKLQTERKQEKREEIIQEELNRLSKFYNN